MYLDGVFRLVLGYDYYVGIPTCAEYTNTNIVPYTRISYTPYTIIHSTCTIYYVRYTYALCHTHTPWPLGISASGALPHST